MVVLSVEPRVLCTLSEQFMELPQSLKLALEVQGGRVAPNGAHPAVSAQGSNLTHPSRLLLQSLVPSGWHSSEDQWMCGR